MRERKMFLWVLIFLLALVLMSGGCGSSGSSKSSNTGGGDTPIPSVPSQDVVPSDDVTPNPIPNDYFASEDIDSAQKILEATARNIIQEKGGVDGKVAFNEFIDCYINELRVARGIKHVDYVKESLFTDSLIDIQFDSGFHCSVGFFSDEYDALIGDTKTQSTYRSNTMTAIFKGATSEETSENLLSAYVGKNFYKALGLEELIKNRAEGFYKELQNNTQPKVTAHYQPNLSIKDFKMLQGYDYIMIDTHGGVDGISLGTNSLVRLDTETLEELNERCVDIRYLLRVKGFNIPLGEVGVIDYETSLFLDFYDFWGDTIYLLRSVFFERHYSTGNRFTKSPIVYLLGCSLLQNNEFSNALLQAGARVVIGYNEDVTFPYSEKTGMTITKNLLEGRTVFEAISAAKEKHGATDPGVLLLTHKATLVIKPDSAQTEYLILNKVFKVMAANLPVPNAVITFRRLSPIGNDVIGSQTVVTNPNGEIVTKLPPGVYAIDARNASNTASWSGLKTIAPGDDVEIIELVGTSSGGTKIITTWEKITGGTHDDVANSIQQISEGGYIVAGNSYVDSQYKQDGKVMKLGPAGNIVWGTWFGGTGTDGINSIRQTADGGYIFAGSSNSTSGDVTFLKNHGGQDAWVGKLNAAGGPIWQNVYGDSGNDTANSIQQTSDGGYIFAGMSTTSTNGQDAWLVKLDASGNVLWEELYGAPDTTSEGFNSVQQTADGGYIAAGWFGKKLWVLKLSASRVVTWQKTFAPYSSSGNGHSANSVQQTQDGGYIVAGYGAGDGWSSSALVYKLDANGTEMWSKELRHATYNEANSIQQTSDGGYVVAIKTWHAKGAVGGPWAWVVKLSSSGDQLPDYIDKSIIRIPNAIQQTTDGGYVLAGSAPKLPGSSYNDFWIAKLQPTN